MFEDDMTFNFAQEKKSKKMQEIQQNCANCSEITRLLIFAMQ